MAEGEYLRATDGRGRVGRAIATPVSLAMSMGVGVRASVAGPGSRGRLGPGCVVGTAAALMSNDSSDAGQHGNNREAHVLNERSRWKECEGSSCGAGGRKVGKNLGRPFSFSEIIYLDANRRLPRLEA